MVLYVRCTPNYPPGMPLTPFEPASPAVPIDRYRDDDGRWLAIEGRTGPRGERTSPAYAMRTHWSGFGSPLAGTGHEEGVLIYGGDAGLRAGDEGRAVIWVDDPYHLPPDVAAALDFK